MKSIIDFSITAQYTFDRVRNNNAVFVAVSEDDQGDAMQVFRVDELPRQRTILETKLYRLAMEVMQNAHVPLTAFDHESIMQERAEKVTLLANANFNINAIDVAFRNLAELRKSAQPQAPAPG